MSKDLRRKVYAVIMAFVMLFGVNMPFDVEVQASETNMLLNYVAIDSSFIEAPATQNIVVSIGDGSNIINSARLIYEKVDTGEQYTTDATKINEDGILFEIEYTDSTQSGEYQLLSVTYFTDTESNTIDLLNIGVDVSYGVDQEVDTNPDAVVVDDDTEESSVEYDISSFDENGNQVSESSIEDAIESSQLDSGNTKKSSGGNVVVVLDPGHGGTDSGASANGLYEKNLTLKIAQYCKAELEQYSGVTVYMTRTDDTYVSLSDRVTIAKNYGADVFVSIHINSASSTSASGVEIYYPNSNYNSAVGNAGSALATSILDQLVALGLNNRGTKIRNSESGDTYSDGSLCDYYSVIRNTKKEGITGIIVEHAFITNTSDVSNYLSSDASLKNLGVADATGIANYFGLSKETATTYNGIDYSSVFNYEYYITKYSDMAKLFTGDPKGALKHFVEYGMSEGRQGSSEFNVNTYKNRYKDLRYAFGKDLKSYYLHYVLYGKDEGRTATGTASITDGVTIYNGVDYSSVYDYNYYISTYSDMAAQYADDDIGALEHFVIFGMSEGRQGSSEFNVTSYKNQYKDLRYAFGKDLKSYYLHYALYGKAEGRTGTGTTEITDGVTIYDGIDYSSVYNYNYYISTYADMAAQYANDDIGALEHFVIFGMSEGRQGSSEFNINSYKNSYKDLRYAFGKDLKSYYLHYVLYGKTEGRIANGSSTITDGVTIYNGVDYSSVYNYSYYISTYADMATQYANDDIGALEHFVIFGMSEGRQASSEFNVSAYRNRYIDLQNAFGNDLQSYYLHYALYGKSEGRSGN